MLEASNPLGCSAGKREGKAEGEREKEAGERGWVEREGESERERELGEEKN